MIQLIQSIVDFLEFSEVKPLSFTIVTICVVILLYSVLYFKKNLFGESNGKGKKSLKQEICVVHNRIDKYAKKIDKVDEKVDTISTSVAHIEGFLLGKKENVKNNK